MNGAERVALRRSIRQAAVDAVRDRLLDPEGLCVADMWCDNADDQEWTGPEVIAELQEAWDDVLRALPGWWDEAKSGLVAP